MNETKSGPQGSGPCHLRVVGGEFAPRDLCKHSERRYITFRGAPSAMAARKWRDRCIRNGEPFVAVRRAGGQAWARWDQRTATHPATAEQRAAIDAAFTWAGLRGWTFHDTGLCLLPSAARAHRLAKFVVEILA
jgi:hypothetical protein